MQENQEKQEQMDGIEVISTRKYVDVIKRNGVDRKTKFKEVILLVDGEEQRYVIKKLTFGERGELQKKFINIQIIGEMERVDVDSAAMRTHSLIMSLHESEFPLNEDYITNELDGELGDVLYKEIEAFNQFNAKKK